MRFAFFSVRHDACGGCRLHVDLMNELCARGHEVFYGLPFYLVDRPFWTPCVARRVSAMDLPRMGRFDAVVFSHADGYCGGFPLSPLVRACDAGRRFFLLRSFLPVHVGVVQDEGLEVVATSRWVAEMAEFYGRCGAAAGGRVVRVFGGVNLSRFCGGTGRCNERPVVLVRESLDTIKGTAAVAEGLGLLRGRGFDFEVAVLRGSEREVRELYRRADVFVSGEVEWGLGWSSVVGEAMACGCAVVCTGVRAVEHLAEDGVTALVFAPGDGEGMADAVGWLLRDAGLRCGLAEAGRRRVVRYSTERMAVRLEESVQGPRSKVQGQESELNIEH